LFNIDISKNHALTFRVRVHGKLADFGSITNASGNNFPVFSNSLHQPNKANDGHQQYLP